jgi:mannose/fructose/N-acetylgalactosamine-specific phosphotransferase system component IIC
MKVYKFIFFIGFLNLTVPFLGIPFVYKNYALIGLAIITIAYALILRAVEQERKISRMQREEQKNDTKKTIEEVVEMEDHSLISDIKFKKKKSVTIKRVNE